MPGPASVNRTREVGHEEQVEVGQMVGCVFAGEHQVGQPHAVGGGFDPAGCGQRAGRSNRLGHRANAANAWHIDHGIKRVFGLQDLLKPAIHGRIDPGILHASVGHLQTDFQVAFDAVEGAHQQACHLSPVFLVRGTTTRWSEVEFTLTRRGVADLDSEASATNQALCMSMGRPMGMPATLGVW